METCKECGKEFISQRSLHAHLKAHDIFIGEYYVKHFKRVDLLTNEPIPFKTKEQYFNDNFVSKSNEKKWLAKARPSQKESYLIRCLSREVKEKNLKFGPSESYMVSAGLPSIKYYKETFKSYSAACERLYLKPLHGKNIPKSFDEDYSDLKITIDTREQKPLNFSNSQSLKLDMGDYGLTGDDYAGAFVDRKSFMDFAGTMSSGFDRFKKELNRCKESNTYLFVVIEADINNLQAENAENGNRVKLHFVLRRMRMLMRQYGEHCQFIFSGSRQKSVELIPKLLALGTSLRDVDIQYFWNKELWLG